MARADPGLAHSESNVRIVVRIMAAANHNTGQDGKHAERSRANLEAATHRNVTRASRMTQTPWWHLCCITFELQSMPKM